MQCHTVEDIVTCYLQVKFEVKECTCKYHEMLSKSFLISYISGAPGGLWPPDPWPENALDPPEGPPA